VRRAAQPTDERTAVAPSPVRTPRRRRPLGAAVLLVWALAWFWFLSRHGGVSWHYFVDGGQLFEDIDSRTGGLHLYGSRPDLQFGPASVVARRTDCAEPSLAAIIPVSS